MSNGTSYIYALHVCPYAAPARFLKELLELGSYASLRNATDEINILLVGMLHDRDISI